MKSKIEMCAIVLLTLLLVTACHNSTNKIPYPTTENIVRLTDQNMPPIEYFTLEKIDLPIKYAGGECFVYNDSMVIVVDDEHPDPYIVTLYNLNTQKEIAGYFKKGNGPNEMLMVMPKLRSNYLYIEDVALKSVSRLNIDSILDNPSDYQPTITELDYVAVCNFVFNGNDTITMINLTYVSNDFGVDGLPEFLQFDAKTGSPLADYKINEKNFPANALQRSIVKCDSQYVVLWCMFPIITIYDEDFNLVKMYRNDKYKDPNIAVVDEGASTLVVDGLSLFFTFGCQTNNFFFANNIQYQITSNEIAKRGGIKWLSSDESHFGRYKDAEIWCFNNNVDLVRRFKSREPVIVHNISYNEKTGNLYMNAQAQDDDPCLYQCIFDKQ